MKEFIQTLNYSGFILMFMGFMAGVKFPDIDLKIKFINHRSIITHSPFLVLLMFFINKNYGSSDFAYFVSAFSIAEAIHMIYDFFPKAWFGTALIKVPIKGGFGVKTSKYFILISIFILMFIGITLLETLLQLKLSFILGMVTFFLFFKKEKVLIRPILMFCIIYFAIGYLVFPYLFYEIKDFVFQILNKI